MPNYSKHQGYVLVMTMLVIALAGVALSRVAQQSLALASQAGTEQTRLQRTWAEQSLEQTLLPRIEEILQAAESDSELPLAETRITLELNGISHELVFGDEQAKTNLNHLSRSYSSRQLRGVVAQILGAANLRSSREEIALDFLPGHLLMTRENASPNPPPGTNPQAVEDANTLGADAKVSLQPLGRWEQVFSSHQGPGAWLEAAAHGESQIARITLWGNGRLNFNRASQESVYYAASDILSRGDAGRLILIRNQSPGVGIDRAARSDKREYIREQQAAFGDRFTHESRCHSLWIMTHTRHRSYYRLLVREDLGPAKDGTSQTRIHVITY
ncbi:MAG: hypothetical protein AAGC72_08135 [Planctomycetota bacterium]